MRGTHGTNTYGAQGCAPASCTHAHVLPQGVVVAWWCVQTGAPGSRCPAKHARLHSAPRAGLMPHYIIRNVMWQLLNGLSFLHQNWVIHRDLKVSAGRVAVLAVLRASGWGVGGRMAHGGMVSRHCCAHAAIAVAASHPVMAALNLPPLPPSTLQPSNVLVMGDDAPMEGGGPGRVKIGDCEWDGADGGGGGWVGGKAGG